MKNPLNNEGQPVGLHVNKAGWFMLSGKICFVRLIFLSLWPKSSYYALDEKFFKLRAIFSAIKNNFTHIISAIKNYYLAVVGRPTAVRTYGHLI